MPGQIIHLAPLSLLQNATYPTDKLVDSLSRLLGAPEDPEIRQIALDALDQAATRLNMAGTFLYRITKEVYSAADGSLTDGQTTFALPAAWGWPTERPWCSNAEGNTTSYMVWTDWERFNEAKALATSGIPKFALLRSELDGTFEVYPPVSTGKVGSITVPYIQRVQRPSEVATLNITDETYEALRTGGMAFVMQYRYKHQPAIWAPYFSDFDRALAGAHRAASRKQNAETLGFRPE